MRRPAVLVASVMLVLGLSACNGDSDEPQATPEPTETTPTGPPPQPEGADGVTWEIQNWEDFADDEAVLVWKQYHEAGWASINEGELLPAARELSTREALQPLIDSYQYAQDNDFVVAETVKTKIEESSETETGADLVACIWSSSAELLDSDGDPVSDVEPEWIRQVVTMAESDGGWIVEAATFDGTCSGGEPA